MRSSYPRRPMRWNVAIGAIARCKATSIGCARKRRSVCALHWTCGGKPKPKGVNKPLHHFIVHGLDKPGCSATVSKEAGITKKASCHTLRHTFATYKAEKGVSAFQLQQWLGHANLNTTQIYVHLGKQKARKVMQDTNL